MLYCRLDNWFNNAPEESPDQEQNVFKNEIKESMQLEVKNYCFFKNI